jgi:hypothetical protein
MSKPARDFESRAAAFDLHIEGGGDTASATSLGGGHCDAVQRMAQVDAQRTIALQSARTRRSATIINQCENLLWRFYATYGVVAH